MKSGQLTCGSGCQWPIGGCGAIGAPSSMSEQFSMGIFAICVDMILPVSWARVMVDRIILSKGIFSNFKRSPVHAACLRPISVRKRSASVAPSKLYCPCRISIKCRTEVGFTASNRSLYLFSSSGVAFDLNGFTKLAGSRLKFNSFFLICNFTVDDNLSFPL